ncbi:MAG: cyanophycin synthetase, partial [Candidatus Tumulicola sp.]
LQTLAECAARAGAPMVRVTDVVSTVARTPSHPYAQAFTADTVRGRYAIQLPVYGLFQIANAGTAIAVLERLGAPLRPDPECIERGLAQVAIPGRMEVFPGTPACVLDIAHNPEKAQSLVASLRDAFPQRRIHYVVAIGESKDAAQIIATLAAIPAEFTFTSFSVPGRRAIDPQRLVGIAQALGIRASATLEAHGALAAACDSAGPDDLVVATGSTFVVAAVRESLLSRSLPDAAESSTR